MTTDSPRATAPPSLVESRRLTGANLLLPGAGAVLDIAVPGTADSATILTLWRRHLDELLDAVGWNDATIASRRYDSGLSLAFSAPIDALYVACELHETVWARVVAELDGNHEAVGHSFDNSGIAPPPAPNGPGAGGGPGGHGGQDPAVDRLRALIDAESNPALLALRDAAQTHDVAFLWDDDEASVGLGRNAVTWSVEDLPDPAAVNWRAHSSHQGPVVLVTGTNGKSTTVRMLARVFSQHGWATGLTSTDGIVVDDEVIEQGDWSGPGGARTLLRNAEVEAAVLEVARGGLLRRGLPIERADAAIVTNVAEDHLGEYGINTLDDLAHTKLLVGIATREEGVLVCNADDQHTVTHAPRGQRLAWISLDPASTVVRDAVAQGGSAWVLDGEQVVEIIGDHHEALFEVSNIPATMGGTARHNVANVLGVTALARSLGVPAVTVAAALAQFRSDQKDNPGRANLFQVGGALAMVDFAHNPHGMTAILDTARRLNTGRLIVHLSQAGDRSDDDIAALAETVWQSGPHLIIAADVPEYLRGREPGAVPQLMKDTLVKLGADDSSVLLASSPSEGVSLAVKHARDGDLLCLMVLSDKEAVMDVLNQAGAVSTTFDFPRRSGQ